MTRRRWMVVVVVLGLGLGVGWSGLGLMSPPEPMSGNRLLSAWLDDLRPVPRKPMVYSARAFAAVQAIGPRAVPSLLAWLQTPNQPLERAARYFLAGDISTQERNRNRAMDGFKLLGPAGRSGWPALVEIALQDDDATRRHQACEILRDTDLATLHRFTVALQDSNPEIRRRAIQGVSFLGKLAPDAVSLPALEAATSDPDPQVRAEALMTVKLFENNLKAYVSWLAGNNRAMQVQALQWIGLYRTRARHYLADLEPLAQNPDPKVSAAATQAIAQIRGDAP